MNGQVGRDPGRVVLVEVGEAIGNQPTPFRSTRRRHCRVEGLLVKHMDEGIALTRKAHHGPSEEVMSEWTDSSRVRRCSASDTGHPTAIAASRESNSMP